MEASADYTKAQLCCYMFCISEVADGRVDSSGRGRRLLVLQAFDRRSHEVVD